MSKLLDDPRLTAYALEELSHEQREEFEMEMKNETQENQELINKEVESIKEQSQVLATEMNSEDLKRLSPDQIEKIANETYEKSSEKKWLKWLMGVSATAVPVVLITLMNTQVTKDLSRTENVTSLSESEGKMESVADLANNTFHFSF